MNTHATGNKSASGKKKVVAFRHMLADGLGSLADVIDAAGLACEYVDTWRTDLTDFDPLAPDVLIVLGGAPGVYQEDIYPFLGQCKRILSVRMQADRPTLGVCLGAQLMAAAVGGKVYPGQQGPEKGWFPLSLTLLGEKSPVRHLAGDKTSMLHWHGDTFDLPAGTHLLASSEKYRHQAFSYGAHCIGLQCHLEMVPQQMDLWLINAAGAVARGELDIHDVREKTARYNGALIQQTELFMRAWLAQAGVIDDA